MNWEKHFEDCYQASIEYGRVEPHSREVYAEYCFGIVLQKVRAGRKEEIGDGWPTFVLTKCSEEFRIKHQGSYTRAVLRLV